MGRIIINQWPYGHEAAVAMRDDDICYFTLPYKIERIYEQIWEKGFKVSLSIIPRIKAINDLCVPPKYRGKMSHHAVCKNRELIEYIKKKLSEGKLNLAQHGYNHEKICGVPEFRINNTPEVRARLRLGRSIIEECLPIKVSVFVSPWYTVSKEAWNVLKQEGLALCRKERVHGLIRNTPWSIDNIIPLTKILLQRIARRNTASLIKGIIEFPGMIELHPSLEWWSKDTDSTPFQLIKKAKEKFANVKTLSGLFCILNHYWFYYEDWQDKISRPKMLHGFYAFADFLNNYDIWKTTLTDVVEWINKLKQIRVKIKRNEITLKLFSSLQGLTIKGENYRLIPMSNAEFQLKEKENNTSLIFEKLEVGEIKIAFKNS